MFSFTIDDEIFFKKNRQHNPVKLKMHIQFDKTIVLLGIGPTDMLTKVCQG